MRRILPFLALTATLAWPAYARQVLWQTNSRGNDVHVYDVETRTLLHHLFVGPEPHGIASPDDASVVYISLEANDRDAGELLWIDPRSYAIRHRLQVGPEPHQIATTPDGRWVYVPCRDGRYWVVDARQRRVVTKIRTGGRPHNTVASRDGSTMFLAPMGEPRRVTVVDVAAGHRVAGEIPFAGSLRPPALSANGLRLFQHVDALNGFQVADVARLRVVATVEHRTPLGWFLAHPKLGWLGRDGFRRCHGLAIRPDQAEIWSACGSGVTVHELRDGYPERMRIPMEGKAYWLTFAPDGRWAFIALTDQGRVAVVDAQTKQVVAQLATGAGPKRNLVLRLAGAPLARGGPAPPRE